MKNILILLLTMLVIGCGAVLPGIVADMVDRETAGRSGSREMTAIALDVNEAVGSLSPMDKIRLLRDGKTIAVTEKEANMTQAEVNAAVERAMGEYVDAGIFAWFDATSWTAQPYLCVDLDAPDRYSIFWSVTIVNADAPYQTLGVDVDDETGTIYSIRYDIYGEYSLDDVWERNSAVLDAFAHIYLGQLGLMEDPGNMVPNMAYGELDGEVLCGTFRAADSESGEVNMEFYVTGSGSFWIYFPQ